MHRVKSLGGYILKKSRTWRYKLITANPVIKWKARSVRLSNRAMPVKGEGKDRKEPRKPRNHTFGKGEGMNLREKALFLAAISRFIKHKIAEKDSRTATRHASRFYDWPQNDEKCHRCWSFCYLIGKSISARIKSVGRVWWEYEYR